MKPLLLVATGGALGSVLRWLGSAGVQKVFPHAHYPWGTLAVNVAGSFAIGAIMTLALERSTVSPDARLFLVTGVLGGFTTFSAFSNETINLWREGESLLAGINVAAHLVLCLGAVWISRAVAFQIWK